MNNILAILVLCFSTPVFSNFNFYKDLSLQPLDPVVMSGEITKQIFSSKTWPTTVEISERNYVLNYSLNEDLTNYIKKQLRRYGTDYTSVVVLDNNTGKVLSAIDYARKGRVFGKNLTFSSTNPAASIFKVITAAELIENTKVDDKSLFTYSGKSSTLYKYQLKDRKNRWSRSIPFAKAFARSNNVVFGKAAIKNTNVQGLTYMANRFGFNKDLPQLLDVGGSKLFQHYDSYSLAEMASGFNRETTISPFHGAVIASIVANDGVLIKPSVINSVTDQENDRVVWKSSYNIDRVLSKDTASKMQTMMELTVKKGTARGAFRPWKTKRIKNITIGGKTGSITGGVPYGKRDWFVSYAKPKNSDDAGISICIMIVNVNKWYIKSTVLAKDIIQYYYLKHHKKQG